MSFQEDLQKINDQIHEFSEMVKDIPSPDAALDYLCEPADSLQRIADSLEERVQIAENEAEAANRAAQASEEIAAVAKKQAEQAEKEAKDAKKESLIARVWADRSFLLSAIALLTTLLINADKIVTNVRKILSYLNLLTG